MHANRYFAMVAVAFALAAPMASFANQPVQTIGERTVFHESPGTKTRAEVKQELAAFRNNPVGIDGYRWVGGERGWQRPVHSYDIAGGKVMHTDNISHSGAKPNLYSSNAEKRRMEDLYRGD